jgi:hypothetical protein
MFSLILFYFSLMLFYYYVFLKQKIPTIGSHKGDLATPKRAHRSGRPSLKTVDGGGLATSKIVFGGGQKDPIKIGNRGQNIPKLVCQWLAAPSYFKGGWLSHPTYKTFF